MAVVLGTSLALVLLGKGAFLLWPFLWYFVRLPLWLKALWLRADIVHNLPMLVDSFSHPPPFLGFALCGLCRFVLVLGGFIDPEVGSPMFTIFWTGVPASFPPPGW